MNFRLINFIGGLLLSVTIMILIMILAKQNTQIKELNHKVIELSEAMTKLDRLLLGDNKHMGLIQ